MININIQGLRVKITVSYSLLNQYRLDIKLLLNADTGCKKTQESKLTCRIS